MKKTRIVVACVLVLSLVLSMVPVFTSANTSAIDVWDGTTVTAPTLDSDGYYIIDSAAKLVHFRDNFATTYRKAKIKLTKDIALNADYENSDTWTAETTGLKNWFSDGANSLLHGSGAKSFGGEFDGQGHTIYGVYYTAAEKLTYHGFIGCLGDGGNIHDVNLKNSAFFVNNASNSGNDFLGFVGYTAAAGAILKNISVDAVFELANGQNYGWGRAVGGILGSMNGQHDLISVTIEGCTFNGFVYGPICGGIVGSINGDVSSSKPAYASSLTIKNCLVDCPDNSVGNNTIKTYSGILGAVVKSECHNYKVNIEGCAVLTNRSVVPSTFAGIDSKVDPANGTTYTYKNNFSVKDSDDAVEGISIPQEAVVSAKVVLQNADLADGQFAFKLMKGEEEVATATNDAEGNVTFKLNPMTTIYTEKTDVKYKVVPVEGDASITYADAVEVTLTYDFDWNTRVTTKVTQAPEVADFTYKAPLSESRLNIPVKVTMSGRDLKANEITVELYKTGADFAIAEGASPIVSVKNAADGTISLNEIADYTEAGTFYYVVKQNATVTTGVTADDTVYNVTVVVTDNAGTFSYASKVGEDAITELTFANEYKATEAKASVDAVVDLSGDEIAADRFSFDLYKGEEKIETVKNAADGKIDFADLVFTEVGETVYTIKQVVGSEAGVTYDETVYTVTVKVTDNGEGALSAAVSVKIGESAAEAVAFKNVYVFEAVDVVVVPDKNASVYDGKLSETLRIEDGTIYIDSAADLALFAKMITDGKTFKETVLLTTDIIWNKGDAADWVDSAPAYEWTCGKWNYCFAGNFDGQGHVISGLYMVNPAGDGVGFFSDVRENVTIKNLAIVNSAIVTSSNKTRMGAFIGTVGGNGAQEITIENCYSDTIIYAPNAQNVGGFVGNLHNGKTTLNIKNSVFAGDITGKSYVGGFLGTSLLSSTDNIDGGETGIVNITDCINLGDINASGICIGGFIGMKNRGSATLKNCVNVGVINEGSAAAFVGAIAVDPVFENCYYVEGSGDSAFNDDGNAETVSVIKATALGGKKAAETLKGFDFSKTWATMDNGYPLPTSVVKLFVKTSNPGTADFIPVAFVLMGLIAVGGALLVLKKKRA